MSDNNLQQCILLYNNSLEKLETNFSSSFNGGFDFTDIYKNESIEFIFQKSIFDQSIALDSRYTTLINYRYKFSTNDANKILLLRERISDAFYYQMNYYDELLENLASIAQRTALENYDNFPPRFAYLLCVEPVK